MWVQLKELADEIFGLVAHEFPEGIVLKIVPGGGDEFDKLGRARNGC